ncbi:hypothetical protein DMA11_22410 [Marinilabiliaceae bacterium JC017]|nr:hypothetical protein DMA11_22410 [Marinilabiliaceae bacterium JC017]
MVINFLFTIAVSLFLNSDDWRVDKRRCQVSYFSANDLMNHILNVNRLLGFCNYLINGIGLIDNCTFQVPEKGLELNPWKGVKF